MTDSEPSLQAGIEGGNQAFSKQVARFMNDRLQSVGIKATVKLHQDCLQVQLEAATALNRAACLTFVAKVMKRLQLRSQTAITAIAVYGQRSGETGWLWQHQQRLAQPQAATTATVQAHETHSSIAQAHGEGVVERSQSLSVTDTVFTLERLAESVAQWETVDLDRNAWVPSQPVAPSNHHSLQGVATEHTIDACFAHF